MNVTISLVLYKTEHSMNCLPYLLSRTRSKW